MDATWTGTPLFTVAGLSQSKSAGDAVVVVVGAGDDVVGVGAGSVEVVVVVEVVVEVVTEADDLEAVAPTPLAVGELVEQAARRRLSAPKTRGTPACFPMLGSSG